MSELIPEDIYVCTTCQRRFHIGPVMLKIAHSPKPDWNAPVHCPHCDATTIQQAQDTLIHPSPPRGQ